MKFSYVAIPCKNNVAARVLRITPSGYLSAASYIQADGRLGSWIEATEDETADELVGDKTVDELAFDSAEAALNSLQINKEGRQRLY